MKQVSQEVFILFVNSNAGEKGLQTEQPSIDVKLFKLGDEVVAKTTYSIMTFKNIEGDEVEKTVNQKYFIKECNAEPRVHDMDFYTIGYCELCGEVDASLYITDDETTLPMCKSCAKEWEEEDATA